MSTFTGFESRPQIQDTLWRLSDTAISINIAPKPAELNLSGDFEGNRIVVADTKYGSDGKLYVYDYDNVSNTWSPPTTITAPLPGETNFGSSVCMDWDGTRIAVGASKLSNVYVYDLIDDSWQLTGTIEAENKQSDFGYSVALAANNPKVLCVGAPLGSNVFVYEKRNDSWLQTFYDNGLNIKNRVPLSATSNVVLKNTLSRYGFHVSISPNGNHIAAGAPGFNEYAEPIPVTDPEYDTEEGADNNRYDLTEEHIEYIENADGSQTAYTEDYRIGILHYSLFGPQTRQMGNVRVFSKGGALSWSDGTNVSFKLGQDIEGEQGESRLDNYPWNDSSRYYPSKGWGFPGFGMRTHISDDLDLVVSSPLTPVYFGDHTIANGAVQRFKYTGQLWEKNGDTIVSPQPRFRFGSDFTLDHSSDRIMIVGSNGDSNPPAILDVLDWNEKEWYNAQPVISIISPYTLDSSAHDRLRVYSAPGENIFVISPRYGLLITKNVTLTQKFIGNSLFSGYLKTPNIYVGINNADDTNQIPRMISFGGTFNDVGYENSIIENRYLTSDDLYGRSEILVYKKTNDRRGLDFMRIKSNEFHIDTSYAENVMIRNPDPAIDGSGRIIPGVIEYQTQNDSIQTLTDNKTIHTPALIVNNRGCVCINHNMNENFKVNYNYRGSVESKAFLDVNGDSLIRNKLTVNDIGRSELKNADSDEPHIFYDTRDTSILYTVPDDSTIRVRSKTRPRELSEASLYGDISGDVTYFDAYKSFYFGGGLDGKIETRLDWNSNPDPVRVSTWILLENDHSTYNGNIFTVTSVNYPYFENNPNPANDMECIFQIISSGFQITYKDLVTSSDFSFELVKTIPKDTWTHIELRIPGGSVTPQIGTGVGEYNTTDVSIWINGEIQTGVWNTVGNPFQSTIGVDDRVICVFGGNVANMYMGMMRVWKVTSFSPDPITAVTNNYNNGPPTEMLAVGGDTIISGKLGVGTTNPTNALDVVGDTIISGKLGVGTTNPLAKLHVVGSSGNVSGGLARWLDPGGFFSSPSGNFGAVSIYTNGNIICNGYLGSTNALITASDYRIKSNINDINDSSALDTLRLLKPKTYTYKDVIGRGTTQVWGFIAQDVSNTIPYSTQMATSVIPNIYEVCNVTSSNIITFTTFDTSQLESNAYTIQLNTYDNSEILVDITEIIDSHTIRISKDITDDKVFVYGQQVDDFVYLKKDAIFTVATAALQEVDRQLQAEKTKVVNLEAQLTSVLARLDALENPS